MAQTAATGATILNWNGSTLDKNQPLFIKPGETKVLQFNVFPDGADRNSVALSFSVLPEDEEPPYMPFSWNNDGYTIKGLREATRTLSINNRDFSEKLATIKIVCSSKEYYLYGDSCGEHVVCTLTDEGELSFWRDEVGNSTGTSGTNYRLWDFAYPNAAGTSEADHIAPWFEYMNKVRTINTNNITYIGSNAFRDLPEIKYVRISDDITVINENVFLGSLNLGTVEMRGTIPPYIENHSFLIDDANSLYVPTIIVPAAALDNYSEEPWTKSTVVPDQGYIGNVHFSIGESDTISQGLALHLDREDASAGELIIPNDGPFPWDAFGDKIKDLRINDHISYIGKDAFASMTNVETVTFRQNEHPIDSIHIQAFSSDAKPRKFALGDPDDGPARPPKITGMESMTLEEALAFWAHFLDNTVLLVPDVEVDGKKAVQWYSEDPFWKQAFNRINDRTVDTTAADTSMVLKWIPLEKAEGYYLTIHEVGCTTGRCDSTIFIPAEGLLGLLDWVRIREEGLIPQYIAARRAPMDEGGGGLVLTISIEENSGSDHTSDVTVNVAGKKNQDYTFTREVVQLGKIASVYTKGGSFHLPDQATSIGEINTEDPTNDKIVNDKIVNIYDLLGRPLGTSLEVLSDGIYIIDNGTKRTTILLRR